MFKRSAQSTGNRCSSDGGEKGVQTGRSRNLFGRDARHHRPLEKAGPSASFIGTAPPDLFQRRPRPLPEGDNRDHLKRFS